MSVVRPQPTETSKRGAKPRLLPLVPIDLFELGGRLATMNRPRGFTLLAVVPLLLVVAGAIESPQYTIVHSESDFEVRLYRESVWMSAPTDEISFEKATKFGAGPLHSSAYFVRFYIPVKFQASPPVPLPELNLHSDRWGSHCIAARQFSGFARDSNVVKEAEKLAISLSQSSWANLTEFSDKNAYSIAQYNSPFHFIALCT
ncbi:hypothetical protein B296_00050974 [Ensete ventricosum]|uniref:Uncharacterized protein n=1 Tax=Ensete ventricosum TaxID=4639 RepID=A0A426YIU8_ENSVE|nr:hypothetical protein B296_00050974 [Ensete ventricosum]